MIPLPKTGQPIYMLGIGGIGMSALARYLYRKGHSITGYDRTETELTQRLVDEGIPVYYDSSEDRARKASYVVYTPAVKGNPELEVAQSKGIPVVKRAELLGALASSARLVAVAGTHGKTTTSSLTTFLLRESGIDASAFVGGILANYETNMFLGDSDWWVAEADEYDRSFMTLYPEVSILTSVDPDHLDIYGTPEALRQSYRAYLDNIKLGGLLVLQASLAGFASDWSRGTKRTYSVSQAADVTAQNIAISGLNTRFDYISKELTIKQLELNLPGQHNLENTLAAITAALWVGAKPEAIQRVLPKFKGVKRRFEVHINTPDLVYIDDYAHHPAELEAVISAAKQAYPSHRLVVAFQPHLFTRTRDFYLEFAAALSKADEVFLTEIYPARELSIPHVTSELIFQHLSTNYKHLVPLVSLPESITKSIGTASVILTTGAGDIDTVVQPLKERLAKL